VPIPLAELVICFQDDQPVGEYQQQIAVPNLSAG